MPAVATIYAACAPDERYFQGEILSGVVDRRAHSLGAPAPGEEEAFEIVGEIYPFVVIVTQDCDLEQHDRASKATDWEPARRANASLTHFLVVVAEPWEEVKTRLGSTKQRERIPQNKDDRYQFLAGVPVERDAASAGVPDLLLDFKRVFSVPSASLTQRIAFGETKRRAHLLTPYVEHLGVRYGHYSQRVGLEVDHHDAKRSGSE